MSGEASHAAKRLAADGTRVQFGSGVRRHVILQSPVLGKTALAHRALVRFFPGVNAPVRRQTARRREPVLAERTLVRLLAGVSLEV